MKKLLNALFTIVLAILLVVIVLPLYPVVRYATKRYCAKHGYTSEVPVLWGFWVNAHKPRHCHSIRVGRRNRKGYNNNLSVSVHRRLVLISVQTLNHRDSKLYVRLLQRVVVKHDKDGSHWGYALRTDLDSQHVARWLLGYADAHGLVEDVEECQYGALWSGHHQGRLWGVLPYEISYTGADQYGGNTMFNCRIGPFRTFCMD